MVNTLVLVMMVVAVTQAPELTTLVYANEDDGETICRCWEEMGGDDGMDMCPPPSLSLSLSPSLLLLFFFGGEGDQEYSYFKITFFSAESVRLKMAIDM